MSWLTYAIRSTIRTIFVRLCDEPERLPPGDGPLDERITDYIAGMTDRFALQEYKKLFDPEERV